MRQIVLGLLMLTGIACGDPGAGGDPATVDAGTTGSCIDGEQTCEDLSNEARCVGGTFVEVCRAVFAVP